MSMQNVNLTSVNQARLEEKNNTKTTKQETPLSKEVENGDLKMKLALAGLAVAGVASIGYAIYKHKNPAKAVEKATEGLADTAKQVKELEQKIYYKLNTQEAESVEELVEQLKDRFPEDLIKELAKKALG